MELLITHISLEINHTKHGFNEGINKKYADADKTTTDISSVLEMLSGAILLSIVPLGYTTENVIHIQLVTKKYVGSRIPIKKYHN